MRNDRGRITAELRSAQEPTKEQLQRFTEFLARTYRRKVPLRWEQDPSIQTGFRLHVGSDIYDWTREGRLRQFKDYLRQLEAGENDILPLIRQAVENWSPAVIPEEIGRVLSVDGEIAVVNGLEHALQLRRQRHGPGPPPGRFELHPLRRGPGGFRRQYGAPDP